MTTGQATSSSWARRPLIALGAVGALVGATYAAERVTVARWKAGPDPHRDEPQSISGAERWVESVDGASLHVFEAGTGPTVVLAHGYTATAHHWAPVVRRLLDTGLRVVVFDQRGHGRSSAGSGGFGTAQLADDLAAVLAETAPDGAVVAGHSMGGIGIQAMLAHHPDSVERVRALVLAATLSRPVSLPLGKLMSRLGGTALARRTMAHRVHGRILARGGVGEQPAVTVLDVVRHGWATCADETRAGVMRDLHDYDFSDALRRLEIPVTVVCGDLDHVTPLDENRRIAELVPGADLVVVPGAGHSLIWEAADQLAELISNHALSPATAGDL